MAAALPVIGLRVTYGDSVRDGCWTNQQQVAEAVKARLAARGLTITAKSGDFSYTLHLYGIGHALKKMDGTRVRCFGHLSYALSSYFYGALNKAPQPILFLAEVARGASFMDQTGALDAELLRVAEALADRLYEKLLADGKIPK